MLIASCSSSRKVTKETVDGGTRTPYVVPCVEFTQNTKDAIRATSSATSPNYQFAKDKANASARAALAQKVEVNVTSLFDTYANQYDVDNMADFKEKTQAITRQFTNEKLTGINITCEKSYTLSSGQYEVWIGIEMPIENISRSLYDQISSEKKIRLDYDYEKFKEELLKEIEKQREQ